METVIEETVDGPGGPFIMRWTFDDSEATRLRFVRGIEMLVELVAEHRRRKAKRQEESP